MPIHHQSFGQNKIDWWCFHPYLYCSTRVDGEYCKKKKINADCWTAFFYIFSAKMETFRLLLNQLEQNYPLPPPEVTLLPYPSLNLCQNMWPPKLTFWPIDGAGVLVQGTDIYYWAGISTICSPAKNKVETGTKARHFASFIRVLGHLWKFPRLSSKTNFQLGNLKLLKLIFHFISLPNFLSRWRMLIEDSIILINIY